MHLTINSGKYKLCYLRFKWYLHTAGDQTVGKDVFLSWFETKMAHNIVQLQKYHPVFSGVHPVVLTLKQLSAAYRMLCPNTKTWASASDGYECSLSKVCLLYNLPIADLLHSHSR